MLLSASGKGRETQPGLETIQTNEHLRQSDPLHLTGSVSKQKSEERL